MLATQFIQRKEEDAPATTPLRSGNDVQVEHVDEFTGTSARFDGNEPAIRCASHRFLSPEVVAYIAKWIESEQGLSHPSQCDFKCFVLCQYVHFGSPPRFYPFVKDRLVCTHDHDWCSIPELAVSTAINACVANALVFSQIICDYLMPCNSAVRSGRVQQRVVLAKDLVSHPEVVEGSNGLWDRMPNFLTKFRRH
jgi:hypothetical protein